VRDFSKREPTRSSHPSSRSNSHRGIQRGSNSALPAPCTWCGQLWASRSIA